MSAFESVLPCGCKKGIVKRMAPACNEDGTPKMEDGAFTMEEVEEIQEVYCEEHTGVLIERQHEIQKALSDGKSYEEAMKILTGASPFAQLGDGSDSKD